MLTSKRETAVVWPFSKGNFNITRDKPVRIPYQQGLLTSMYRLPVFWLRNEGICVPQRHIVRRPSSVFNAGHSLRRERNMTGYEQRAFALGSYEWEDALMEEINRVDSSNRQKMDMLRNRKYIEIADVQYFIDNLWLHDHQHEINYRYIWACYIEEQEEINSNGW